ncbi:hypothetical protein GH714_042244 [Hevea brasiliensis]|uniref:AB hydrolase-1 domain-containing protein n=1 Tax=Hevea brasiliensis TaxID=3981 RepID=A0A6A6MX02_HEVBR|nr:hypothetical protein GH714_042217 [Hevea brasiliensis]KAF2316903.1 hypothetical protein GH714_042244 [Hevea brasiliensis]
MDWVLVLSFRKSIDLLGSKEIHRIVFDLPGNGFSDKSVEVSEERGNGILERILDAYGLINEKGLFWVFDNMVETGMVANWVLENSNLVRSITLSDTGSKPALPLRALKMPVIREVVLGSNFAYEKLIRLCCSKRIGGLDLETQSDFERKGCEESCCGYRKEAEF